MTDADRSLLRGLIEQFQVEASAHLTQAIYHGKGSILHDLEMEHVEMAKRHADQLSVVLSSLQENEEKDVTRNGEAVLTPESQLPHRRTE